MEKRVNVLKRSTSWIALLLLTALVLTGCGAPALAAQATATPVVPVEVSAPQPVAPTTITSSVALAALEGTLEQIYAQVNPSVVNIRVVQQVEASALALPQIPGFEFPFQQPAPQEPQYQQVRGSGFVWDKEGHIVTNNHVVEGANKIEVTFYDGSIVPAELVGADPDSDLAVIKVDVPASQLQPVQVTDSTQVKVGQLAVAIGNPFALEGTMTLGIISAVGRSLPAGEGDIQGLRYTIPDVIQTDAPINPGNSGGVLVDDQGQLIGVTAAIESPVQANAGIGFAIPATIVQKVVPALIETGHYDHPRLGLSGTDLRPELATAMGLDASQRGALVVDVTPGSPADAAGLRGSDRQVEIEGQQVRVGGDVIVAIDNQPVQELDDVVVYLARNTKVGQTVTLTVLRNGEQEKVQVTLDARSATGTQQGQTATSQTDGAWLGISGLTITPEIAQAMDLKADQTGVLIVRVEAGSPADEANLRGSFKPVTVGGQPLLVGGDVITALDGQAVKKIEDLQMLVRQTEPGQEVTLTLLRDGKQIKLPVTLGKRSDSTS
jgi:serine protease Do